MHHNSEMMKLADVLHWLLEPLNAKNCVVDSVIQLDLSLDKRADTIKFDSKKMWKELDQFLTDYVPPDPYERRTSSPDPFPLPPPPPSAPPPPPPILPFWAKPR